MQMPVFLSFTERARGAMPALYVPAERQAESVAFSTKVNGGSGRRRKRREREREKEGEEEEEEVAARPNRDNMRARALVRNHERRRTWPK